MRKIIIVLSIFILHAYYNNICCQVFYEDFQSPTLNILFNSPPGILNDTNWYSYDQDTLPDGSGEGRPGTWFKKIGFSSWDSLTPLGDTNFVMASNSKFTSPGQAKNWLITPSIYLSWYSYVRWKSATLTTPYQLDGYKVLVSTTTNDISAFTDTVYTTAEYVGPGNVGGDFGLYSFSPSTSWIQDWDGSSVHVMTEIEYTGDSSQWVGILTPKAFGCYDPFINIYLAFVHDSFDDNLLSIDDIKVETCSGLEINKNDLYFNINPNPFNEKLSINLRNTKIDFKQCYITIIDVSGRLIQKQNISSNNTTVNTEFLQEGIYTINLYSNEQFLQSKKIIKSN